MLVGTWLILTKCPHCRLLSTKEALQIKCQIGDVTATISSSRRRMRLSKEICRLNFKPSLLPFHALLLHCHVLCVSRLVFTLVFCHQSTAQTWPSGPEMDLGHELGSGTARGHPRSTRCDAWLAAAGRTCVGLPAFHWELGTIATLSEDLFTKI